MLLQVNTLANIGRFVMVLLIFILVLALTYFTTRYIANFQKQKIVNGNISIIETFQIAPNKYIQIASVGKKYYAFVVCKDNVTLLGELSKEDINFDNIKNNELPSFKDIIERAKSSIENKHKDTDDDTQ